MKHANIEVLRELWTRWEKTKGDGFTLIELSALHRTIGAAIPYLRSRLPMTTLAHDDAMRTYQRIEQMIEPNRW